MYYRRLTLLLCLVGACLGQLNDPFQEGFLDVFKEQKRDLITAEVTLTATVTEYAGEPTVGAVELAVKNAKVASTATNPKPHASYLTSSARAVSAKETTAKAATSSPKVFGTESDVEQQQPHSTPLTVEGKIIGATGSPKVPNMLTTYTTVFQTVTTTITLGHSGTSTARAHSPVNPKSSSVKTTSTAPASQSTAHSSAASAASNATSVATAKSTASATPTYSLTTPTGASCATMYNTTTYGVILGPNLTVGYNYHNKAPKTFIYRTGSTLYEDAQKFRIAGVNIYWLGLDNNWCPTGADLCYPSKSRIREAMAMAVAMGSNTVRSHTLGISTGNSYSLWPKANTVNEAAFDKIDYAIYAAKKYGLRLIIPLTDEYAYYHGGKRDFIRWAGGDTSDISQFYTNTTIIRLYKAYITDLLTHVNAYTGVALKDEPTIMAWETGNEMGAYFLQNGAPPSTWTGNIANHIKSLSSSLVFDGTDGLIDDTGNVLNTGLSQNGVDAVTDHIYPAVEWLLTKDQKIMEDYNRNYYIGEYDWTGQYGGDSLSDFYAQLEDWDNAGILMWSLFGHDDACCNWVEHNDGYSFYYPHGNEPVYTTKAKLLMQTLYNIRGLVAPDGFPAVQCPQELI